MELTANPDGTANLIAWCLPPERANAAFGRLDSLAGVAKGEDDPRSIDQVRCDVLLDLLDCGDGCGRRGVIDLRVDLATLTRLSDDPGEISGYGPVVADIARRVAATQVDSVWRVAVTHPDDGAVLWDGTTRRRPTSAQRRYVGGPSPHLCIPRVPHARHPLRPRPHPRPSQKGDPLWSPTWPRRAATTTGSERPDGKSNADPREPSSGPVPSDTNTPPGPDPP